ncbi:regulator of G-protein signaling 20-like isoform X1 [Varroa jacobsoni]|uniref:regulator of G-protein signaling 20-like isoform X1 n=1 Tax=Varroa jacobsoni TaxID=62625 RepID=UPI000BFA730D|nr:regulator of G-protein signaling 20-like isoform X1 [Varroa jacobsoni]
MSNKRELQLETASGKPCAKKCLSEISAITTVGGGSGPQPQVVQKDTGPPAGPVAVTIRITETSSSEPGLSASPSTPNSPPGSTDLNEPASASDPLRPLSPELPEGASEGPGRHSSSTGHPTHSPASAGIGAFAVVAVEGSDGNGNNGEGGDGDTAKVIRESGQTTAADHPTTDAPADGTTNPATQKTCCFCWCCCCSCSCNNGNMRSEHANSNSEGHSDQLSATELWGEHSPPPLDVILEWGGSFDKLMRHPAGRKIFRDYLRCEYSEENILFWLACEELKKETKEDQVEEKARLIYEDFISILSPREVSLDSRVRDIINKNMVTGPTASAFDEAQLQIYTLMKRDSYPRFVTSPIYRKITEMPAASRKEGKLNLTKEREGQTECVKKTGSSHDVSARRQLIIETL